ncbi:hypothetical protein BBW78_00120 [Listeria monocytogenes]|nr:hypothetical protein [Listeria monocytogenes]
MDRLPILRAYDVLNKSKRLKELMNEINGQHEGKKQQNDDSLVFVGKVPSTYHKESLAPMICLSHAVMTPQFSADNKTNGELLDFLLEIWVREIADLEKLFPIVNDCLESLYIEATKTGIEGETDLDLLIGWKKYNGYFAK